MKKVIIPGIIFFLAFSSSVLCGEQITLKVKVRKASIRMAPEFFSAIVKQVPQGKILRARAKQGEWYEILLVDSEGTVFPAYIHHLVVEEVRKAKSDIHSDSKFKIPRKVSDRDKLPRVSVSPPPGFLKSGIKFIGGLGFGNIGFTHDPSSGTNPAVNEFKKYRMGFMGGVGYEIGDRMGLEIDILYLQKGVKFAGEIAAAQIGEITSFDTSVSLDEISAPMLLKYRFMSGSTPFLVAGGEIAYILSSKAEYWDSDYGPDRTSKRIDDISSQENFNNIDYGFIFGTGIELHHTSIPLLIEARYHMGMANLFKEISYSPDDISSEWVKSRMFLIMVGIRF